VLPSADDVLHESDKIIIIGKNNDVDALIKIAEKQKMKE